MRGVARDNTPQHRFARRRVTMCGGRIGAIRIIGYSPSAGFVITVIATGGAHAGVTAWKSSGADLHDYEGQEKP